MARKTTGTAAGKSSPAAKRAPRRKRPSAGEIDAREDVVLAGNLIEQAALTPGRSGNVSVRYGSGMLISPSGMYYSDIKPKDVVFVDGDGMCPAGQLRPSSEWRFHLSALRARPDRGAVVHTHSMYSTILACRHEPIPAFHYMVAVAGGTDIPCIPYAPFGSDELADLVAGGLKERDAVLMANHGLTVLGRDMEHALEVLREVETLAEQYVRVLALGGAKPLGKAAMADVLERFKTYGQNAQDQSAQNQNAQKT